MPSCEDRQNKERYAELNDKSPNLLSQLRVVRVRTMVAYLFPISLCELAVGR